MSLLCPKCMNQMRQYERNRVIVDQCTECGGLFLDRGELEQLAQAEQAFYGEASPPPPPPPPAAPERQYEERRYESRDRYDDRRYEDRKYDDRRYDDRRHDGGYRKSKRKSFLAELFDD